MKNVFLIYAIIILNSTIVFSQKDENKIYNPEANAKEDIELAIKQAINENKNIMLLIGGNWCPWCVRLHKFIDDNTSVDSLLTANYVVVDVNYSKENKNLKLLKELKFPQRFGFPVIVILNQKGEQIHTQNTVYLEEDKSYGVKKLSEFFKNWFPAALDISNYKDYK
jgi:thioredoxin-related protein